MPNQVRKKLYDKSSLMILIGYHLIGGCKLYDLTSKKVVINRNVIIDELEEWDWNDNVKNDLVLILCDESTSESDSGIRPEKGRIQEGTSKL